MQQDEQKIKEPKYCYSVQEWNPNLNDYKGKYIDIDGKFPCDSKRDGIEKGNDYIEENMDTLECGPHRLCVFSMWPGENEDTPQYEIEHYESFKIEKIKILVPNKKY